MLAALRMSVFLSAAALLPRACVAARLSSSAAAPRALSYPVTPAGSTASPPYTMGWMDGAGNNSIFLYLSALATDGTSLYARRQ